MEHQALNSYKFTWLHTLMLIGYSIPLLGNKALPATLVPNSRLKAQNCCYKVDICLHFMIPLQIVHEALHLYKLMRTWPPTLICYSIHLLEKRLHLQLLYQILSWKLRTMATKWVPLQMMHQALNLYKFTWPCPLMLISYSIPFLGRKASSVALVPSPRLKAQNWALSCSEGCLRLFVL
jgi:hypothetical protein